MTNMMQG